MRFNVLQPRLQYGGGVSGFFVKHRGHRFASSALMKPMTQAYVANAEHFVDVHGVPRYRFSNGQRKDDVTAGFLADHDGGEGVLYVGTAQERAMVWSSTRRVNPATVGSYTWLIKKTRSGSIAARTGRGACWSGCSWFSRPTRWATWWHAMCTQFGRA